MLKWVFLFGLAVLSVVGCTPRDDANGYIHLTDQTGAMIGVGALFPPCHPNDLNACGGLLVDQSVIVAHAASNKIIWDK